MKKINSQALNSFFIILGGVMLLYEITGEKENVYILIVGIVFLMFGLYRATNHWIYTKDDHKQEDETDQNL